MAKEPHVSSTLQSVEKAALADSKLKFKSKIDSKNIGNLCTHFLGKAEVTKTNTNFGVFTIHHKIGGKLEMSVFDKAGDI